MIVKLLTEHHLEFLSLKVGCRGSSESTLVKMSNLLEISCRGSFITETTFNLSYIVTPHNIKLTIDDRQSNAYCISLILKITSCYIFPKKILVHVRTPREAIGTPWVQLPPREVRTVFCEIRRCLNK